MGYTYRMIDDKDLPKLLALWHESGGWDQADEARWRHRFIDTPGGSSQIAIAEDDENGAIAAQMIYVPSGVVVDGELFPAVRPFAPIVSKDYRRKFLTANPLQHPIVKLFRTAAIRLEEIGVGVSFMLPDPQWALLYKMLPGTKLQTGSFPLWSLRYPLEGELQLGDGFSVETIEPTDERIDRLFELAARNYGCIVCRDTRGLEWKLSHGLEKPLGITRGAELVGLVSCQKRSGQWMIGDMLAVDTDEALRATIAAACNAGAEAGRLDDDFEPRKAGVLATDKMTPVLEGLGFYRDKYDFPFVVRIFNDRLKKPDVAPERWYLSAND